MLLFLGELPADLRYTVCSGIVDDWFGTHALKNGGLASIMLWLCSVKLAVYVLDNGLSSKYWF